MGNVFVQSVILYFRLHANFKIKDNTERNWHWRLKWELIKSKIRVYYVTYISLHDNKSKGNGLYRTNGTNVLKDTMKNFANDERIECQLWINNITNLTENQFFFQATMIVLTRPAISSTFNVLVTFCKTTSIMSFGDKTVTHIYQKAQCSWKEIERETNLKLP